MKRGMSLIEVMIFIAVLSIAIIGTSGYRYFSTLGIRMSDIEITAGRIASQLCESWKGIGGGSSTYNPTADSYIGFNVSETTSSLAPDEPLNFNLLSSGGKYKIITDNNEIYYASMSYYITTGISGADPNLETLNVTVTWSSNISTTDSSSRSSFSLSELLITH